MDGLDKLIMMNMKDEEFREMWFEKEETYAIAHNVFVKREGLKMTEEELSEKLSLSAEAVGDIEFGEYEITEDLLQKLAIVLETDIESLKEVEERFRYD